MVGAIWSFLLRRKPIRDEVERQVTLAVRRVWRENQRALRAKDDEHREAVADADRRIAVLTAAHAELSKQLPVEAEEQDEDATSDLFCCMECTTLWLLSTRPDKRYSVLGPIGKAASECCSECQDDPLLRLTTAKAKSIASGEAERVARPVGEAPVSGTPLAVPGASRVERSDVGVKVVADLLKDGPEAAVAKSVARKAGQLTQKTADRVAPATRCSGLNAIATGLDTIPKAASRGVAWVATEIVGIPSFPARVLGEVVAAATLPVQPLRAIARGIRIVGAVSCAADNRLGHCQCARHLVGKELPEKVVEQRLKTSLDKVTKPDKDITEIRSPVDHDKPAKPVEEISPFDRPHKIRDVGDDIGGIDQIGGIGFP